MVASTIVQAVYLQAGLHREHAEEHLNISLRPDLERSQLDG
jgi:hypothetical protein